MPQKRIDIIGPRLRNLALRQAEARKKKNKVPGETAWKRFKWIVENEYLKPVSRVGANVNPLSKKEERGKASVADLFQATMMGIGAGWPAAGKGANTVGILRRDIFKSVLEGPKMELFSQQYYYKKDMAKNLSAINDLQRILKFFKDEYLDAAPERGLKLKSFRMMSAKEMPYAGGSYSPAANAIKVAYHPDYEIGKQIPRIVGHELTHWWGDFIRNQFMRRSLGEKTAFTKGQFAEGEKILSDLVGDIKKSKNIIWDIKADVHNRGINYPFETDIDPIIASDFFKTTKASTEHASTAWENVFAPGTHKWDEILGNDPNYIPTKIYAKAVKNLQEMGWHREISDKLMLEAFKRKQGKPADLSALGKWYKRQPQVEKERLKKRFEQLVRKK